MAYLNPIERQIALNIIRRALRYYAARLGKEV
jgi:hypothetical protein